MHAKKLAVNDGSKHEKVKDVTASFPDGCVAVLLLTFLVEAVDLCDLTGLVVASNEDYPIRISIGLVSHV